MQVTTSESSETIALRPAFLFETSPQELFIRGFVQKFNPKDEMFVRAIKSVSVSSDLEEARQLAQFFASIGLIPPRLDEWSIVIGAASARIVALYLC